jgi:hypothetical protein
MKAVSNTLLFFTFVVLGFYSLLLVAQATGKISMEFPFGIFVCGLWVACPFLLGLAAILSYKRQRLSVAHRAAYYGCLVFLAVLAIAVWMSFKEAQTG